MGKIILGLFLLGCCFLMVCGTEPYVPFEPEQRSTDVQITYINALKEEIASKIRQHQPGPPITFIGVLSHRLRELPPNKRKEYLIKLQINHDREFWGVRISDLTGSPLVLQDVFGPMKPDEMLQDLKAPPPQ